MECLSLGVDAHANASLNPPVRTRVPNLLLLPSKVVDMIETLISTAEAMTPLAELKHTNQRQKFYCRLKIHLEDDIPVDYGLKVIFETV